MRVGRVLAQWCQQQGWEKPDLTISRKSQLQLAKIRAYLRGEKTPTYATCVLLARALGCSKDDLLRAATQDRAERYGKGRNSVES